jgi:hypothetical protein
MAARRKFLLVLISLALVAAGRAAPALQTGTQVSQVPLTQLGLEPFAALQGPYAQVEMAFSLPPDWQALEGSAVTLDLQNFFSSFVPVQGEVTQEDLIAGHLSVRLDGELIYRNVLSANGAQQLNLPLPAAALSAGPQHRLTLDWDASASCALNLSSTVLIEPSSALTINYANSLVAADLSLLPYPFFMPGGLESAGSVIVLPTDASETQVAAGLAAAAALGRWAPEQDINLVTENALSEAQRSGQHLIFVGPLEAFRSLQGVVLPHSQDATLRLPAGSRAGLGFIEAGPSPWNVQRAVLVISGGSDAAVLRAAIASGGALILNEALNLALIPEDTQPPAARPDFESATLAQLGQGDHTFSQSQHGTLTVPFYISPERALSDAAFLDLRLAHSQLLDYVRSSITVAVNDTAVSTTRLVDQTAPRHSEVVLLPLSLLRPGLNELQISADVVPLDVCANPAEGDHWLTVYADTNLNLPNAADEEIAPLTSGEADFGNFPLPFLQAQMQGTALLLPGDDPAAWAGAARLLRGLAATYQAWPLLPQVRFASATTLAGLEAEQAILLGGFGDFLSDIELGDGFGIRRNGDSGEVQLSSGEVLGYAPGVPLGAAALGELPNGSPALAVLGTDAASLDAITAALTAPNFAAQHDGARLLAQQGATSIQDTGAAQAAAPETEATEQAPAASGPVSTGKGIWLWPLLLLMLAAFGLVAWEQAAGWVKGRGRK